MAAGVAIESMTSELISQLQQSVHDCADRALTTASKWSSELLLSLPPTRRTSLLASPKSALVFSTSTPARPRSPRLSIAFPPAPTPSHVTIECLDHGHAPAQDIQLQDSDLERQEETAMLAARSYMAAKEFHRAVYALKECKCLKAKFLDVYGRYLAYEKTSMREWYRLAGTRNQPPAPVNRYLLDLLGVVQNFTDPWLLFLKGLFLYRLSRRAEAIESVVLSLAEYAWNWSAWTLLGHCINDVEELASIVRLIPVDPSHPILQMFQIKTMNDIQNPSQNELMLCDRLLSDNFFPTSAWVMSLRACVLYHLHDFSQAETQYEKIIAVDPYRIDDIDVFSNILYVTENRLKLARLAQDYLELDKDRPEVCCLVGNYYSLRADHEKAVKYFKRATELDRSYLSAWTLMGHEFVEMKNSHAAIEAYRRAVDISRKDYRAWYGLGQAYELLSMHQYALYYYQHATSLRQALLFTRMPEFEGLTTYARPYDVRLWQAQGSCYEELGKFREAIECLKRALLGADPHETIITLKLAKLHEELDELTDAANYHQRIVQVCQEDARPVPDYAKSAVFVAHYHMGIEGGDVLLAKEYLEKVAQSNAEEVSRASEMLKRLEQILGQLQDGHEDAS
ncbi:cell division control protein 23 [Coniophora puteana RWD-64-598 SS2]|uniref:Cell division control protein 23 n=1 Tax=Coniophora puteana (strain RWD-64-598) TaxID=741705 RepID=A0A5M3MUX8_CONPW|nr:cell division control protein 23 [Coniophora puteana RWD-64-598 SS2]EIW82916.1 cell division control protein 23 [Coniophora puteana RWD-64-598 SS2]